MSTCELGSLRNHSDDIVEVYSGSTTPVILCGLHASEAWGNTALVLVRAWRDYTPEERLQRVSEDFDTPFRVTEDGPRADGVDGVYAPEVFHDDEHDITIDGVPMRESRTWEALTGYTSQYGYNGAVLASNEFIGGGLARDMLAEPGTYVVTAVEVLHDWTKTEDVCRKCGGSLIHLSTSHGEPGEHFICEEDDCRTRIFILHDEYDAHEEPAGWAVLRKKEND